MFFLDSDCNLDETLTASECGSLGEAPMDISQLENIELEVQYGPESKQERDKCPSQELKKRFESLNCIGNKSDLHTLHALQERVIVDITKLFQLFENKCRNEFCAEKFKVLNYKLHGGVVQVSWKCPNDHYGYWVSAQVLCKKNGQDIFSTSLLLGPWLGAFWVSLQQTHIQ